MSGRGELSKAQLASMTPLPFSRVEPRLPTLEHAGLLEDLTQAPGYLLPQPGALVPLSRKLSCSFCGVGDGGELTRVMEAEAELGVEGGAPGPRPVGALRAYREVVEGTSPTTGCIKLRHSMMRQRAAYPIQLGPSERGASGRLSALSYEQAIQRLASLLLAHRAPEGRTLAYASGQVDYFAIFALQEVLRLLGVRNLTGNAEHCLNAGAVHNEMLTGQEGPFVTIAQAVGGANRFYLFNGWNGYISHPPVFHALLARRDVDAYLVDVMVTESAKALAAAIGSDRILLIRPKSDPHLALAVAHEILLSHPRAVDRRFIERFGDGASFQAYAELARSERFAPERVAERIAPEPNYAGRLLHGIRRIALKLAQDGCVPVNIPSVGLSQSTGAVAHCLWGSALGLVGKYGLDGKGALAGGTLRLPGQINAESEVQGLSRKYFMGRIPIAEAADAAERMGLPSDAYAAVQSDVGRAALDYSEPTPGIRELFICIGTQFEANMMGRKRWLDKLGQESTTLVVIDPLLDSWSEEHADLVVPSPPHPAAPKLYQNGEWKLTLSVPQKHAPRETRSDATIVYDVMEAITERVLGDPIVAAQHPDLARHARSGYLTQRFCRPERGGGLSRIDGEVSRPELWERIQAYMSGGAGPLYCRPEHASGEPITYAELFERGSLYYGGVGQTRFKLDYDDPSSRPFADIYRRPARFKFFTPSDADLELPSGVIFNSGRSCLSDERKAIAFAIGTFNSGKATPIGGMPQENSLFIAPRLAERHGVTTGQRVRLVNPETEEGVEFPAVVSDRLKGDMVYASFHKSRAQMDGTQYVNDLTSHEGRCAYTSQTNVKATRVRLEPAARARIDTTVIDPRVDLPLWSGRDTPLYVTEIIEEARDVYTFRLQGDPVCRFAYFPGQFCTLVLDIDGKRVVRSYSISSSPARPFSLEITVKRVPGGLVSNWLPDHLKVGDRLQVAGPKGKFCLVPGQIPRKVLLLGAGSGLTPLMSMSRWLYDLSADVDVKLVNSIHGAEDQMFRWELALLSARYKGFSAVTTATAAALPEGWAGLRGRIDRSMLLEIVPDVTERQVYMCGPDGFMVSARELLVELGCDLERLHSESFASARSVSDAEVRADGSARIPSVYPGSADVVSVEFARAGKKVSGSRKLSLLELSEAHGIELDYACRIGSCGACKVRVLEGVPAGADTSGLDASEREQGYVLACVTQPTQDCVLDA